MNFTKSLVEPERVEVSKPGRGRPATITLETVERVARLIAKGMTEEQACVRVGVNHASLRTARHRNPEFETAIKKAQAEYLDEFLDIIGKGSRGWQGRAWILERRHGEQFRRNTGLEVNALVGPFSAGDALARKPLDNWTKEDFERSVGAWTLLRHWTKEQLARLVECYDQVWGEPRQWTDDQLAWAIDLRRHILESPDQDADNQLASAPLTPLLADVS